MERKHPHALHAGELFLAADVMIRSADSLYEVAEACRLMGAQLAAERISTEIRYLRSQAVIVTTIAKALKGEA